MLTALHCVCSRPEGSDTCFSKVGTTVKFYTTGPGSTSTESRTVARILRKPGTEWDSDDEDWTDSNGDFADLAIFQHWKLVDEPAMLVGMDLLGLLEVLIIDYRRKELQVKLRDRGVRGSVFGT